MNQTLWLTHRPKQIGAYGSESCRTVNSKERFVNKNSQITSSGEWVKIRSEFQLARLVNTRFVTWIRSAVLGLSAMRSLWVPRVEVEPTRPYGQRILRTLQRRRVEI